MAIKSQMIGCWCVLGMPWVAFHESAIMATLLFYVCTRVCVRAHARVRACVCARAHARTACARVCNVCTIILTHEHAHARARAQAHTECHTVTLQNRFRAGLMAPTGYC
jgi:hypothetical protein